MKKACASAPGNRARIRTIKAGSVHRKIYTGTLKKRPIYTVYWRVGEKPCRKLFADPRKAEEFAKAQAEQLAAEQVHAPAISISDAQTYREAQRRLAPVDVPLCLAAGEYADIVKQLGDNGTVRQAVEFFLHNAVRPDLIRTTIQIFTPLELRELLTVADGQAKLAIIIGAFTGIRSAEILRLNWEEGVIDIGCDQTKTASRRLVPILEPLLAWIRPFVKRHGSVLNYSLPACLAEAFGTAAKKADALRREHEPDAPLFKWKQNGSTPQLRKLPACGNGGRLEAIAGTRELATEGVQQLSEGRDQKPREPLVRRASGDARERRADHGGCMTIALCRMAV